LVSSLKPQADSSKNDSFANELVRERVRTVTYPFLRLLKSAACMSTALQHACLRNFGNRGLCSILGRETGTNSSYQHLQHCSPSIAAYWVVASSVLSISPRAVRPAIQLLIAKMVAHDDAKSKDKSRANDDLDRGKYPPHPHCTIAARNVAWIAHTDFEILV